MPLRREYVSDRRIGFAIEQLAIDALEVLRAVAVLDLKPVPGPLDVGSPGFSQSLVDPVGAPVLGALAQAVRGEEEDRFRAGELGTTAEVLAVGDADGGRMPELVF